MLARNGPVGVPHVQLDSIGGQAPVHALQLPGHQLPTPDFGQTTLDRNAVGPVVSVRPRIETLSRYGVFVDRDQWIVMPGVGGIQRNIAVCTCIAWPINYRYDEFRIWMCHLPPV